jgi:hypothetical protein
VVASNLVLTSLDFWDIDPLSQLHFWIVG